MCSLIGFRFLFRRKGQYRGSLVVVGWKRNFMVLCALMMKLAVLESKVVLPLPM